MDEMAMPQHQSFLMWVITTLGINAILLPLCAGISFLLTLLLVLRGKGPMTGAALLFIVPAPLIFGFWGALKGSIASFSVLAMSDVPFKASEVAAGVSEVLLMLMAGLMLTAPSYLLAVSGLFFRSLQSKSP